MLEKLEAIKDNLAEVQQPALATPEKEEAIGFLSKSEQIQKPSRSGAQAKANE
jgi:predicted Zn-ribbon and HTH transcriptional regulator